MHVVLVPGLWLDASCWAGVGAHLREAGHQPHPLTLPGLESTRTDRSTIGLVDQVAAVVAAIDEVPADERVLLVGHSAGCGVAHAALDARVDRVAGVVHVGGFPTGEDRPVAGGFPTDGADLPLPPWEAFDDADVADLDDAARAAFRERAVPSPARLVTDRQHLSDARRHEVPVTVVCPEFTADDLRGWIADGEEAVAELARARHVDLVDLPSGHWPQLTRPTDLARVLVEVAGDASA